MNKTDVTISLAMLSQEQRDEIDYFSSLYGFSVAGFMRFCTLKLIQNELKPSLSESQTQMLQPKQAREEFDKRKVIANIREEAGLPRTPPPQSNVAKRMSGFGTARRVA